jgi:hypothetical protein
MNENEMIVKLTALCNAYRLNDYKKIEELEPIATQIGKELDVRGGISEMRRIFGKIPNMQGKGTLEMHWGGIGDWRG